MTKHRNGLAPLIAALALSAVVTDCAAASVTTANGPYYATPSWDQTLPSSTRFIVLSNMNSEAVLDRETGLVWQRTPLGGDNDRRDDAVTNCALAPTGGRQGWRLPRVDELMSLADPSNSKLGEPHLPAGHPFNAGSDVYWAADHIPARLADGGEVVFFQSSVPGANLNEVNDFIFSGARAWCVRGGSGSLIR
jgi:Protein of unknown function (DUF1566)